MSALLRRAAPWLLLLALAAASAAGLAVAVEIGLFLSAPPEREGAEKSIFIESGSSFAEIAAMLEREGLVRDARRLGLLARLRRAGTKVRAGEYLVRTDWTPGRVLEELVSGREVLHRLAVPEGLTLTETARLAEDAGMCSAAAFTAAASDEPLLREHGITASSAEGYLFPETYLLPRRPGDDCRPVVRAMLAQFRKAAAKVWPGGSGGLPAPAVLHEIVTLASVVEKETGTADERPTIAGVYANRLRLRMPLQADPTVIYGLGPAFDGNLKRVHLEDTDNAYNTYQHPGLPPGPIASPGYAALAAAAHPEEHDYLYFVAKGDGAHHFSKNLAEHNRAVARYQLHRSR